VGVIRHERERVYARSGIGDVFAQAVQELLSILGVFKDSRLVYPTHHDVV
jgi:predicted transcriptional regulator